MLTDVFSIIFIIIISLLFNLSLRFGTEHYISEKGGLYSSGGADPVRVRLSHRKISQ